MLSCGVCGHCSGLGCKYGATLGQRIDLKRPSNFDLAWLSKRAKRGPRERVEHAVGCARLAMASHPEDQFDERHRERKRG